MLCSAEWLTFNPAGTILATADNNGNTNLWDTTKAT
jgi:hypothetical protein